MSAHRRASATHGNEAHPAVLEGHPVRLGSSRGDLWPSYDVSKKQRQVDLLTASAASRCVSDSPCRGRQANAVGRRGSACQPSEIWSVMRGGLTHCAFWLFEDKMARSSSSAWSTVLRDLMSWIVLSMFSTLRAE